MRKVLLALVPAFVVSQAAAETAAPKETVTVFGQKPSDREAMGKVVARFVDLHSARDRKSGLLVREDAGGVCPLVIGLPDAYDDFVAKRIAAVAESVGVAAQPQDKCDANVEVFFSDDPQGVVNALSHLTHGAILGYHFTHQNSFIVHVARPIQAWYVTGTRGDAHTQNSFIGADGVQDSAPSKMRVDTTYGASPNTGTGSRLRPHMNSRFINALIVADLHKVGGGEIGPVADYVALLALSQPNSLGGCSELPSILDLMSDGCPGRAKPTALTEGDMAYLRSLYASDISTSGARSAENVANGMTKELVAGQP